MRRFLCLNIRACLWAECSSTTPICSGVRGSWSMFIPEVIEISFPCQRDVRFHVVFGIGVDVLCFLQEPRIVVLGALAPRLMVAERAARDLRDRHPIDAV